MFFNMITAINESKKLKINLYHAIVDVNLIVEIVTYIKRRIMIKDAVSARIQKNIRYYKKRLYLESCYM